MTKRSSLDECEDCSDVRRTWLPKCEPNREDTSGVADRNESSPRGLNPTLRTAGSEGKGGRGRDGLLQGK